MTSPKAQNTVGKEILNNLKTVYGRNTTPS
jgi:hypothetical protein